MFRQNWFPTQASLPRPLKETGLRPRVRGTGAAVGRGGWYGERSESDWDHGTMALILTVKKGQVVSRVLY